MKNSIFLLAVLFSFVITAQNTYVHCGKLIDTKNAVVLTNKTIIITGKKILSVQDGFVSSDNSEDITIDLKDKTVMPGLIDMHVHIESQSNPKAYMDRFTKNEADIAFGSLKYAEKTLMAGFTTVRDMGGSGVNIALRNAIAKGEVKGPRIFTAGKAIGTTGGHADPTNGWKKVLMGDPGPKDGVINSVDDAKKSG